MKVGFIGAGQMGRPMVDRLIGAGHDVRVLARRREAIDDLRDAGIAAHTDARAALDRADVVIVCVFDDHQLRRVLLDDGTLALLAAGTVLVSHVTGSPTVATTLQAAAPDGVAVLDVPISGTAEQIRAGTLALLVGGELEALETARPALAAYGNPILHVGALGDSQVLKLLNNALFSATFRAACDAALLAQEVGLSPERFVDVVRHCSGDSYALRVLATGQPEATAAAVRRYLRKDVAAAALAASERGLDLGRLGRWAAWFDEVDR